MHISALTERVDVVSRDIQFLVSKKALLEASLSNIQERIQDIEMEIDFLDKARYLYQKVSNFLRLQISEKFVDLVSKALSYIFQKESLSFNIELDIKSNLPTASFYVNVDNNLVDPKDAVGGSIYEVIGLCLRMVCLDAFDLDGPLFLDEPLRSVDDANLQNALDFVIQHCRNTNRQLFVVTHNPQVAKAADALFEVTLKDGMSEVKEVT